MFAGLNCGRKLNFNTLNSTCKWLPKVHVKGRLFLFIPAGYICHFILLYWFYVLSEVVAVSLKASIYVGCKWTYFNAFIICAKVNRRKSTSKCFIKQKIAIIEVLKKITMNKISPPSTKAVTIFISINIVFDLIDTFK